MRPQVSQFLGERKKETDPTECTDLHFPDFATSRDLKPRARRGRKKKTKKAERYALQPKYPRGQSSRPH
jgi:hypothetical protein